MILKRYKLQVIIIAIVFIAGVLIIRGGSKPNLPSNEKINWVQPKQQTLINSISTTGTVEPRNRIQIKPPINGRIEQILVEEGEQVKKGDIIAYISSSDRTALIDAARIQDPENIAYWEDLYKPTAVTAPLTGTVISRPTEPGQSITVNSNILILSNYLIVKADVDETDIGSVKLNQVATITLQAYPDSSTTGTVEQIAYESKTQNNITIYPIKIYLSKIPNFFRSGMSANVDISVSEEGSQLTIPISATKLVKDKSFVYVKDKSDKGYSLKPVTTGSSNDDSIAVLSGVKATDYVLENASVLLKQKKQNTKRNPFMFQRKKKEKSKKRSS